MTPVPNSPFRFLIDENVQSGVAEAIWAFGYQVYGSRRSLSAGAPDEDLARLARSRNLIIVSHDRDFRVLLRQTSLLSRRDLRQVPLLQLGMSYARSVERTRQCWPVVEHHLDYARSADLEIARISLLEQEIKVRYRFDRPATDEQSATGGRDDSQG